MKLKTYRLHANDLSGACILLYIVWKKDSLY